MKHKVRTVLTTAGLMLFPVVMNFLSPVVPVFGAMDGVITGSLLVFAAMFVTGMFFGRAWCGWACPMAALADLCAKANGRPVNVKRLRAVRLVIFSVWAGVLAAGFFLAGGVRRADFLYLTEAGVSVDEPMKYIMYYMVLAVFLAVNLLVGRRGSCHSFCWMSPFIAGGYLAGKLMKLPQLRINADAARCVDCGGCDRACPMSLPVGMAAKIGAVETSDCILCGECVKACAKGALRFGVRTAAGGDVSAATGESV